MPSPLTLLHAFLPINLDLKKEAIHRSTLPSDFLYTCSEATEMHSLHQETHVVFSECQVPTDRLTGSEGIYHMMYGILFNLCTMGTSFHLTYKIVWRKSRHIIQDVILL